ncbi:MAG: endo alpha-1,4 polygalactosaminidase [Candidatus Kryptoniota bacterium]
MKLMLALGAVLISLCAGQIEQGSVCSKPLSEIRNFAPVYFRDDSLKDLSKFDMVILDPDNYTENQIGKLKKLGTMPLAYLNVGEIETYREYVDTLDPSIALSPDPHWNRRYFVDVCDTLWLKIVEKRVRGIMADGFCGIYADFGGLLHEYPNLQSCSVNLIKKIKSWIGNTHLVVNNEPLIVEQLGHTVDGICIEGLIGKYDFELDSYITNNTMSVDSMITYYSNLARKFRLAVLDIEYAPPSNLVARRSIIASIRKAGFVPYVGTIELDTLFFDTIRHAEKNR